MFVLSPAVARLRHSFRHACKSRPTVLTQAIVSPLAPLELAAKFEVST
jgi:hypothetical protein